MNAAQQTDHDDMRESAVSEQTKTAFGRRGRLIRGAVLLALALGISAAGATGAAALPPDGPAPDYPGTSSRVWPTTVKAGDTLNFEVSGYPANEIVYIKIDDGTMCTDTSHGACVYHTQALDGNGYARGSIIVPNLAPGAHWLRMLATGDVFDSRTGQKIGYEGYSRRGGNDFTVIAGGTAGGASTPGGAALNADGTLEGGSVSLESGDEAPGESMDDITTNVAEDGEGSAAQNVPENSERIDQGSGFPVLGAAVLGGSVLLGGGAVAWALLRGKKRPAPIADAAESPGSGDDPGTGEQSGPDSEPVFEPEEHAHALR